MNNKTINKKQIDRIEQLLRLEGYSIMSKEPKFQYCGAIAQLNSVMPALIDVIALVRKPYGNDQKISYIEMLTKLGLDEDSFIKFGDR